MVQCSCSAHSCFWSPPTLHQAPAPPAVALQLQAALTPVASGRPACPRLRSHPWPQAGQRASGCAHTRGHRPASVPQAAVTPVASGRPACRARSWQMLHEERQGQGRDAVESLRELPALLPVTASSGSRCCPPADRTNGPCRGRCYGLFLSSHRWPRKARTPRSVRSDQGWFRGTSDGKPVRPGTIQVSASIPPFTDGTGAILGPWTLIRGRRGRSVLLARAPGRGPNPDEGPFSSWISTELLLSYYSP